MSIKYKEALNAGQLPSTIRLKLFDEYFKPILNVKPTREYHKYFLGQSELAWRHDINKKDIDQLLFISSICNELCISNKEEFLEVLTSQLNEEETGRLIITESEKHYYESKDSEFETKAKSALDHYKTLFETGLRIKATVPYYFICKSLGIKNKVKNKGDYIRVSAGEKYQAVVNRTIDLPKGNLSKLVNGFDNNLRNAGGGHDSYELTDKQTIILNITDPKSGEIKKRTEITLEDLKQKTDDCRRSLWILTNGVMVFLNNNPRTLKEVGPWRKLKIFEIKKFLEEYSYDRWMKLSEFKFEEDKKKINIELTQINRHFSKSTDVLFSNGEKYIVITVKNDMNYEKQTLGIIGYLVNLMNGHSLEILQVKVQDLNGAVIIDAVYEHTTIVEKMKNGEIPKPRKGDILNNNYPIFLEFLVKPEVEELTKIMLKAKGYEIIE